MAMFYDDSTDDETCYLQLGERLRINKSALASNCKSTMNEKDKKQLFNLQRQKPILDEQSSSSSSLDMLEEAFLAGSSSSQSMQNKKRQNGDKPIERFGNPKRTCLDDVYQRSTSYKKPEANNDIPHSRRIVNFAAEPPNSSAFSLFPDKTYEDHASQARRLPSCEFVKTEEEDSEVEVWPCQNKKITVNGSASQQLNSSELKPSGRMGVHFADNIEDGRNLMVGALRGGRQSPDPAYTKKVAGRKAKRVLKSDNSDSDELSFGYRSRPVIFSSSDSEDSKPIARLTEKPSDVFDKSSSNPSNSAGRSTPYLYSPTPAQIWDGSQHPMFKTRAPNRRQRQPVSRFNTIEDNIGDSLESCEMQSRQPNTSHRRTLRSNRHAGVSSEAGADPQAQRYSSGEDFHVPNSTAACRLPLGLVPPVHQNTATHHLPQFVPPPHRNLRNRSRVHPKTVRENSSKNLTGTSTSPRRRALGRACSLKAKPNLASASLNFLDTEDSSEVEFFTANSYSDNESTTETLNERRANKSIHKPEVTSDLLSTNVGSSEDEISVVFSSGPSTIPPWRDTRLASSRTLGRRYNRRSRQRISDGHEISLSPDPVEQVRQVEEDERFARMLQAQFDAETDPPYRPHPSPNPCQMNSRELSSSDEDSSNVDIEDNGSMLYTRRSAIPRTHVLRSHAFLPDTSGFNLGTYRYEIDSGLNDGRAGYSPFPYYREMWLSGNHMAFVNRNQSSFGSTFRFEPIEDSYEAFLGLAEMNGDVVRGLQKSEINRLPTRTYVPMNHRITASGSVEPPHKRADLNKECQVCLNDYVNGDVLRILPCFHEFHTPCIDPWLKINHTCPVCRVIVDLEE